MNKFTTASVRIERDTSVLLSPLFGGIKELQYEYDLPTCLYQCTMHRYFITDTDNVINTRRTARTHWY
jgi:hypothetical protein